ncbi:hypothetical protein F4779DRAFT_582325 [Xylariaceae sp. FL0662B]|nr:hypothetical protein F4779DRAFT_582325 [Xylariaceae sp. FL0662B]
MFELKTQCSCPEDAARAWGYVDGIAEVTFDNIVMTCDRTIDLSLRLRLCRARVCPSGPAAKEMLLQTYGKLTDMLEAAIITYTLRPAPPRSTSIQAEAESRSGTTVYQDRLGRLQAGITSIQPPQPRGVVCLPSTMSLGQCELDDEQSAVLALEMVCRSLRKLACALQQMRYREAKESYELHETVVAVFSRMMRSLSRASAILSTITSTLNAS